ncbi:DUF721 domain-containing protein [Acidiphilium sp. AL]|uniref:DUF721 domain-containing protein n=1 Tax=Acidiphilium sp. AL TaxID=2871704 RepID=UPI0021CB6E45|nr:DUF721 domain-containing protein [Acidiphilium sp. AL]
MTAKAPPVEPARHYAPRGIAALIAPVLRPALRRRGAALATLLEDWPAVVGPGIAARSLPVKCAAGTLTIGCAGPDALEFQHMAPTLTARINLALGGQIVARLRFVSLPAADRVKPGRSEIGRDQLGAALVAPVDAAALPDGPIGAALARLARGLRTRRSSGLG